MGWWSTVPAGSTWAGFWVDASPNSGSKQLKINTNEKLCFILASLPGQSSHWQQNLQNKQDWMGSRAGSVAELALGACKVSKWSAPPQVFWHFYLGSFLQGSSLFEAHQSATAAIALLFWKYSGKIADNSLLWAGCGSAGCVVLRVEKENCQNQRLVIGRKRGLC